MICEGQLDLIACYMAGTRNIVAPQGTAFTSDHARILKRYVNEVVLCFDSDVAGQQAAVRVLDSLLSAGLAIRVATVPAPHDPDSFIKAHGGAAFQDLVQRAEGFFDYYLNRLCSVNDLRSDKGRLSVVSAMCDAVLKTGSAVLADTYAQKTALRLGVAPEAIRAEFKKGARGRRAAVAAEERHAGDHPPLESQSEPSEREFWLLRFLLSGDDHVAWLAGHLDLAWIEHPVVRRIVDARLSAHRSDSWRGVPGLLNELDDPSAQSLITEAVAEQVAVENLDRKVRETVIMLRNGHVDRELNALTMRLREPGISEAQCIDIERRKAELRQMKRQVLE